MFSMNGFADTGIAGAWSGTIRAAGITASANVSFSENGSYYISAYGLSSSGSYTCSGSRITFNPSTPGGFNSTTMSLSLNGNKCTISGSVKGISGTLTLTRKTFKLSKSSATVDEGKSLTLTAFRPNGSSAYKNLLWTSSDTSIASVTNKGKVKTFKPGIVTITATAANGDTAFCVITVRSLAVASIALSKYNLTLQPGKYFSLTATLTPKNAKNKALTWTSSNSSVATVSSNGKVKGLAPGVTTITVTAANGIRAACIVTVVEIQVSRVKISRSSATMYTSSALQLKGVFTPSNATNRGLHWTSSNPDIAAVTQSGLVVSRNKPGKTTITIVSANGKYSRCVITVKYRKPYQHGGR